MINQSNLETLYDCLYDSTIFIMEKLHKEFFASLFITIDHILNQEVSDIFDESDQQKLTEIYQLIMDIDFTNEEIRKCLQLLILYGFKVENILNSEMTPDTLGFFIAYLINKLCIKSKKLQIFDPVIGSGNLLLSVINHLNCEFDLYGIDHNELFLKLAKANFNMGNYDINLYLQDTLTINIPNNDFIIMDTAVYENNGYFPHQCIVKHIYSLKDKGYLIGIIPNDFFDKDVDKKIKEQILKDCNIVGLIELPNEIFKGNNKSILILQKTEVKAKDLLIVSLPNFHSVKEFNKALIKIENWFAKYLGGVEYE